MIKWFESKKNSVENISAMQRVTLFIAEYQSSKKQDLYAIALWGIVEAFNKIFGSLKSYHQADLSLREKYLAMIGEVEIQDVRERDFISASCNNFFINYLTATKGLDRDKLRGSIEQAADVLDGIVRNGALKMRQTGEMEEAVRELLSEETVFRIGSGVVKGAVTERAVVDLSKSVLRDLQQILQTEEDYYWFVIEQHDRLLEHKAGIRSLLDGLALFPIEYEGRRSEQSYVGKPNPGVTYMTEISSEVRFWCAAMAPTFDPNELSLRVVAALYAHFRFKHKSDIDMLRLKYATHYHNNYISSGHFRGADRWNEVISAVA